MRRLGTLCLLAALSVLLLAFPGIGCYSPTFPEGILCSEDRRCPGKQICAIDNRCYDSEQPATGATLSELSFSVGELDPVFDPTVTSYSLEIGVSAQELVATATAANPAGVSIRIQEEVVASGIPSAEIPLDLGTNTITIDVTAGSGVTTSYLIEVNRGIKSKQVVYVKASNAEAQDRFGTAIAIDRDIMVVGAHTESSSSRGINGSQENNGRPASGAVYIFARTNGAWTQQAYIKSSNSDDDDNFGGAVAVSQDTVVVGAPIERSNATGVNGDELNNGNPFSGAAYVFVRVGSTWTQQAYIKASNTDTSDVFGSAVAISGDTIVVGAPGEDSGSAGVNGTESDNSANSAGAAYVFVRNGVSWSQQAYLKSSNPDIGDGFGFTVAIEREAIVVGARGEDSGAQEVDGDQVDNSESRAGAAYVFTRAGGSWSQQAYLKASNAQSDDEFGGAVSIAGDQVAIGAPGESSALTGGQQNNAASFAGAVYVYRKSGSIWSQEAYLKASNPDAEDRFGTSLAILDSAILVGASREASLSPGVNGNQQDNSGPLAGAAYLFVKEGQWDQLLYVKASNPDGGFNGNGDSFGASVALSADTFGIGAFSESSADTGLDADETDNSARGAGALYIFE